MVAKGSCIDRGLSGKSPLIVGPTSLPETAATNLLAGESYAGVYIPLLAEAILSNNMEDSHPPINLKASLVSLLVLVPTQHTES